MRLLTKEKEMKTLALMFTLGIAYAASAAWFVETTSEGVLGGDDKFALFLIGMVAAVFTARKMEWID
jgi:hypothetical protein